MPRTIRGETRGEGEAGAEPGHPSSAWLGGRLALPIAVGLATAAALVWWQARVEVPVTAPALDSNNYDAYVYYYPTFDYAFRELRAGRFPFWNPYQHCGSPFFATGQHLLLYPLNLFFLLLPTAAAMQATAVLHLAIGLLFAALLGRVLGLAWPATAVAAVAFVFSPAVASLVVVAHHLYGAVWMPLHLALTHLVLTRRRRLGWAVLLGASLAAQYLGGYPMFCLFSAYAIAGYALWWAACAARTTGRDPGIWQAWGALGVAAALAVALSAPQLLPGLELARLGIRGLHALPIEHADPQYGLIDPAALLLDSLLPSHGAPFRFLQTTPAPGWIVLALVAAAPCNRRQRRPAAFFAVLSLLTFLLGFGRYTPLYGLYFHLPTADLFRIPLRFFALTGLGIAVLAGIGADGLWRARRPTRGMLVALAITAVMALALYGAADALAAAGAPLLPPSWSELGLAARLRIGQFYLLGIAVWLAAYTAAGTALRRGLVAALPLCVYLSLGASFRNTSVLPEMAPDLLALPDEAAELLHSGQGYHRTHVSAPRWGAVPQVPAKAGMLYGLYVDSDRENAYTRRFDEYTERLLPAPVLAAQQNVIRQATGTTLIIRQGEFFITSQSPNLALLDLMGTRFVVDPPTGVFLRADTPGRFQTRHDGADIRVYENTAVLPRAFVVQRAEVVGAAAVLDRMTSPDFDPRTTAVLEEPPAIALGDAPGAGAARIVEYGAHRVVIETDSAAAGLLVLTDQYYPGWEATVDDRPAPLQRADYLFRAVPVPAGAHRVELRFVPRSFYRGCAIAALAVVGLGVGWVVVRRRRSSA